MKKRIFKKVLSAVLACCMVLGGNLPYTPGMLADISLTANAAGECYLFNSTTGILTLKGNVVHDEIAKFEQKSAVKTVKTDEGTILPENCASLFASYVHCTSIDLSNADTSSVTNMRDMFSGCSELTTLDLSSFDTSKVNYMHYMFSGCSELISINLSSFDTSKVYYMDHMFANCRKLTSLDLIGFDTSKVKNMEKMFERCSALTSLDLSSFSANIVESADGMFSECTSLSEFTLGKDFGDIVEGHMLPNGKGWVKRDELSTIVSGSGVFAVIQNEGTMKYIAAGDGYTLWFDANGGTGSMKAAGLRPDSNKVASCHLPDAAGDHG